MRGQPSASRILSMHYKDVGSPRQVGARFLRFLLQNERTFAVLYHMVMFDNLESGAMTSAIHSSGGGKFAAGAKPEKTDQIEDGPASRRRKGDVSLEINAFDLISTDAELGHMLLRYPMTLLPVLEDAAIEAQSVLLRKIVSTLESRADYNSSAVTAGLNSLPSKATVSLASSIPTIISRLKVQDRRRIHARLVHLPPHLGCCKPTISCLTSTDIGMIIQISGTVVRASPVRMIECTRPFKCKKCGFSFEVLADFEQIHNAIAQPTFCPNATSSDPCSGSKFEQIQGATVRTDYQEIKLQESTTSLGRVGAIPRSIMIKMTHDLVDSAKPGDNIVVVGSLMSQWEPVAGDRTAEVSAAMRAHSVRVINTEDHAAWGGGVGVGDGGGAGGGAGTRDKYRREFDKFWSARQEIPIAARNYIVRAVCPKLYGMHVIKLSLLITLIGGTSEVDPNSSGGDKLSNKKQGIDTDIKRGDDDDDEEPEQFTLGGDDDTNNTNHGSQFYGARPGRKRKLGESVQTRRRAQSHILLVGDPGTGKSQFLRFAAALSPRSVLTTGTGSSSAGLTCAAVKDGSKEFTLEAGALVLADRGVCCIDEFGCMRPEDRTTIHEAMEQQTLSVAKAGIVCKLNSRATVVAVMNPKSSLYQTKETVERNTNIDSPLLSRFDLIFVLLDCSSKEDTSCRDSNIASFLLNQAIRPGAGYDYLTHNVDCIEEEPYWGMEKLRAYIATVKERFQPSLSPDAALLLQRHYEACRRSTGSSIQISVRYLEALIRLSQAHARLMYRDTVTLQDAVAVIIIMQCSAATFGGLNATFHDPGHFQLLFQQPVQTDFPDDSSADDEFAKEEDIVLWHYKMGKYSSGSGIEPLVDSKEVAGTTSSQSDPRDDWSSFGRGSRLPTNPGTDGGQAPQGSYQETQTQSTVRVDQWGREFSQRSPMAQGSSSKRSRSTNDDSSKSQQHGSSSTQEVHQRFNSVDPLPAYDKDEAAVAAIEQYAAAHRASQHATVTPSEKPAKKKKKKRRNRGAD